MVITGTQRAPPADTKYPPAAHRKQAKRAYVYKNLERLSNLFEDYLFFHTWLKCDKTMK